MAYKNHKFCWHGIISTDVAKAKAFYPEVTGWSVMTMPMGDTEATMFAPADGIPRMHLSPPHMEGMPSHWENYLRVEDVDASSQAAVEAGGKLLVPGTDIPVGRFSVVTSPSGAALHLFHEASEESENSPQAMGGVHWVELHSTDIQADLTWLKTVFGFTIQEMPMPGAPGGIYYILMSGSEAAGGAMETAMQGAPAMWMTWISVENVDDAAAKVTASGGQLFGEAMEAEEIGRMIVAADSTGGVFGLITPA